MKIKPTYVTFEQTDEIWKDIILISIAEFYKSKETPPFSEEDMIEFGKYCIRQFAIFQNRDESFTKRILPEWKEQQLKIVYYE